MKFASFISNAIIPITITLIVCYGLSERIKIFDCFLEGAKEGIDIVVKLMPTLIGLFVPIGLLRYSGIIDLFIRILEPIISIINFPKEIMPLALLRPISGSSSIAIGTDIMNQYGVDSKIGMITSTIMGSTETTLYTIAIYTSVVSIKKSRGIIIAALIGDVVGMLISVILCRIMS